ncbi:MAG: tetratricopeptide repeat protein [bacterium]
MEKKEQNNIKKIMPYISEDIILEKIKDQLSSDIKKNVIEGSLLLVDLSGFSDLSDRISKSGKFAPEDILNILNRFFSTILEVTGEFGGILLKFSGDAMLVLFRGRGGNIRRESRLQAISCAYMIKERLKELGSLETPIGPVTLTVNMAINNGRFTDLRVGSHTRIERIISGSVVEELSRCEDATEPGEISLTRRTYKYMEDCITVKPKRGTLFLSLTEIKFNPSDHKVKREKIDTSSLEINRLKPYLPIGVFEKLISLPDDLPLIGEHRKAVILFINYRGLKRDLAVQNIFFNTAHRIVRKYDGMINKIDPFKTGERLMVVFGVPTAHEDDEMRASFCAVELMKALISENRELRVKIGMHVGHLFAGNLGSQNRREYTVIGGTVNIASRLMEITPSNSILSSEELKEKVVNRFWFNPMGHLRLKGIEEPKEVSIIQGIRRVPLLVSERRSIIGRDREVDEMTRYIKDVRDGKGTILIIDGEAGIGKTRLVEEALSIAVDNNFRIYKGDCTGFGRDIPFYPWRSILNDIFGLTPFEDRDVAEEKVSAMLKGFGQSEWTPVLCQALGFDVQDTPLTASLDPELKRQRVFDMVLYILKRMAHSEPILIIIDDLQWIDPTSKDMLYFISPRITNDRLFIILALRPEIDVSDIKSYKNSYSINLTPLDFHSIEKLIKDRTGLKEISNTFINLILDISNGNPFYTEEITNLLFEKRVIVKDEKGRVIMKDDINEIDIPQTVNDIILSRVDFLDERTKGILKVASVIGRTFRLKVLDALQDIANGEELKNILKNLERLDITLLNQGDPDWEYIFKHLMTHDVVYSTIPYGVRIELHGKVAKYLEEEMWGDITSRYELIAYHNSNANQFEKAYEYYLKAAQKAARSLSCRDGLKLYELSKNNLIKVFENKLIDEHDYLQRRYEILLGMGTLYNILGDRDNEGNIASELNSISTKLDDNNLKARASLFNSSYLIETGVIDLAREEAEKTHKVATEIKNEELIARALLLIGKTYQIKIEIDRALEYFIKSFNLAKKIDLKDVMIASLINIAVIYHLSGQLDKALKNSQKALAISEEIDDLASQMKIINRIGEIYGQMGELEKAREYHENLLAISRRVGARLYEMLSLICLGLNDLSKMLLETSVKYFRESLSVAEEIKSTRGIGLIYLNMGVLSIDVGLYEEAEEYLRIALERAKEIGDKLTEGRTYTQLGRIGVILGKHKFAEEYLIKAEQIARQGGIKELEIDILFYRTLMLIDNGQYKEASETSNNLMNTSDEIGNKVFIILSRILRAITLTGIEGFEREEKDLISKVLSMKEKTELNLKELFEIDSYLAFYYYIIDNRDSLTHLIQKLKITITRIISSIIDIKLKKAFMSSFIVSKIMNISERLSI